MQCTPSLSGLDSSHWSSPGQPGASESRPPGWGWLGWRGPRFASRSSTYQQHCVGCIRLVRFESSRAGRAEPSRAGLIWWRPVEQVQASASRRPASTSGGGGLARHHTFIISRDEYRRAILYLAQKAISSNEIRHFTPSRAALGKGVESLTGREATPR